MKDKMFLIMSSGERRDDSTGKPLAIFDTKEKAEKFVKKYCHSRSVLGEHARCFVGETLSEEDKKYYQDSTLGFVPGRVLFLKEVNFNWYEFQMTEKVIFTP